MAYIGKEPQIGAYSMLDNLTASATASYSLTLDSVAFVPESANHLIVSLNGVIQKAGSSFTVSGSTLTFSSTLASSDSIDFVLALGSVLDIGTPSDATVTKAKTNFVSSGTGYTGTGLDIKGNGVANGRLGLLCSAGSHGVALESPDHSSAQSYTIQLPSNSPTVDKVIKVTSLTGSGATAIAHTQFSDAGGGQWTHILTSTASNSSSIDFSSTYITTTYLDYMFVFSGIKAGTDNYYPRLLFSTDNGSSYLSDYRNARLGFRDDSSAYSIGQAASGGLYICNSRALGSSTGEAFNGVATVFDPLKQSGTTDSYTYMTSHTSYLDNDGRVCVSATGNSNKITTAVNNIRFNLNSGNLATGKVSLYGRKIS